MSRPDYQALLARLKSGTAVAAAELTQVASELRQPDSKVDKHLLLNILLESGVATALDVAEEFVEYEADPMLARLALQGTYLYSNRIDRHVALVHRLIEGVAWDPEDDVRVMAISAAGYYLTRHSDNLLWLRLVRLLTDGGQDRVLRACAAYALGTALRDNWARSGFSTSVLDDPMLVRDLAIRGRAHAKSE